MRLALVAVPPLLCGLQGCGEPPTTTTTSTTTVIFPEFPAFNCSSPLSLRSGVAEPARKGFAVDDATCSTCSEEMLSAWPHTVEPVASLRLFAAWKPEWSSDALQRERYWASVRDYLLRNNAKVLLGVNLLCKNQTADDEQWAWTFALMHRLGAARIMGVAFGNELDNQRDCDYMLGSGEFFERVQGYVTIMDQAGFTGVSLTSVWAWPFVNKPFTYHVEPFLKSASASWGSRWTWSFNPYPIWDPKLFPRNSQECHKVAGAISLEHMRGMMELASQRVWEFTGRNDSRVWIGEAGWSSPVVDTDFQYRIASVCPSWSAWATLFRYYENLMSWDLSLRNGGKVDHLFFFTMRDVFNDRGGQEHFGLLSGCGQTHCKVQALPAEETGPNGPAVLVGFV